MALKVKRTGANREPNGKEKVYTQPEDLLAKAFEYFAWCEDNPWYKKELMRSGDRKGEIVDVPVWRPFTLSGLCVYCGISQATFAKYKDNEHMKDAVTHLLEITLQNQQEGAIAGAYNSPFISRMLDAAESSMQAVEKQLPFVIEVDNDEQKEALETLRNRLMNNAKDY